MADTYCMQPDVWGKTVVFFLTIKAAKECSRLLNERGIPTGCVTGTGPRESLLKSFEAGELQVLTNVLVLTEGFDCLCDATEVLTPYGWKGFTDFSVGDWVYGLNRETGQIEETKVEGVARRPVREGESFVTIKSQHADIKVTEGHNFFIKYRDPGKDGLLSDNWLQRTGKEMAARKSSYGLPISGILNNGLEGISLTDDEIKFVAWYMTDGCLPRGKSNIIISQSEAKMKYVIEIRELLTRLELDFKEYTREPSKGSFPNGTLQHRFYIPKGNGNIARKGWEYLEAYITKEGSDWLHDMSVGQFRLFWKELLKGDGSVQGNRSGWLWCDRKSQVDLYMHLALVRGFAASYAEETTKYGTTVWRVSVREKQWLVSDPNDDRAAKINLESPASGDHVWCVQNPLGTIITRRNGKVAILGNCPDLKSVFVRPGSKAPTIQMAGRAFRKHPDIPIVNVVQSGDTRFPFNRHARPIEQWVLKDGSWRRIDAKNLHDMIAQQRKKMAKADFSVPSFLKKAQPRGGRGIDAGALSAAGRETEN